MNLALITIFLSLNASALPKGPQPPQPPEMRRVELVKCNAGKIGTLWASFGRMWRSEDPLPKHFPTEIVLFQRDGQYRLEFPDFREAIKIPVRVGKVFGLEFTVATAEGTVKHKITSLQYDAEDDAGFLGNWSQIRESDGKEISDQVACTVK